MTERRKAGGENTSLSAFSIYSRTEKGKIMEESDVLSLQRQYQKFSDFYFCYCGQARCQPLHSYGPAVRPNYLRHYILEGRGIFRCEGREYELGKGEGFLIEPDKETFYQSSREEPWTYLWVGFDGANCKTCLRSIGLGNGQRIFRYENGQELKKLVESMLSYNKSDEVSVFLLQSLLCQFFACLAKEMKRNVEDGSSRKEKENLYVYQALEFIHNNYANGITVGDIARYVALDRSYLFTLFRNVLNSSPQEYLARFRLTRAKEQLILTNASVANIAFSCGYQDPQVFSKAFKQQFGMTPVKYRSQERACSTKM